MTFKVQTLNNIAASGLDRLPRAHYEVASELGRPDAILVSLGLDGHAEDPFGFFRLTDEDFLEAVARIRETARSRVGARAPVGFLLEGGYSESVLERLVPRLVARLAEA